MTAERLTMDVPEVAATLGVHPMTVRASIKRGDLPAIRVGRRVLVPRKALENWLARGGDTANVEGSETKGGPGQVD